MSADELSLCRHPRKESNYSKANDLFEPILQLMFASVDQGWATCHPDHLGLCLFLHEHLLPSLTGLTGSGVATSTLQGWVSTLVGSAHQLGPCFDFRGRSQDWCNEGVGNPVRSGCRACLSATADCCWGAAPQCCTLHAPDCGCSNWPIWPAAWMLSCALQLWPA